MHALELKNVSWTVSGRKICDNISFQVFPGEVHAILGENGAGKSTLMKMIYGEYTPDTGSEIYISNKRCHIKNPTEAIKLGIGMVHQHFRLLKPFTVLENIILGLETTNLFGFIDKKASAEKISKIMDRFHFHVDLNEKVENLTVGAQQRIEIIKVLYRDANLIILDEPTAVLTPQEIVDFYRIIKSLKENGKTILIITHKLHEIKEIADRCTIIRKGQFIETVEVKSVSEESLASKMVGREVHLTSKKNPWKPTETITLKIENLKLSDPLKNKIKLNEFSLSIKAGTITGLAGIDGNGQSELVNVLTGLVKKFEGAIFLDGENITAQSAKEIYQKKLSVIPEDRQSTGLILDFKVSENLVFQTIDQPPYSHLGFIDNNEITKNAHEKIARFDIRPTDPHIKAANLSGGNQQKIILAREIGQNPKCLIAFQPTRGLDVGAIEYIHNELLQLRDSGVAILLISYELDEIINLCDEIAVIHEGENKHFFSHRELTDINSSGKNIKEVLGLVMAGGTL
jgi:ABC-type uncharacterized transport system ATPase subunit